MRSADAVTAANRAPETTDWWSSTQAGKALWTVSFDGDVCEPMLGRLE